MQGIVTSSIAYYVQGLVIQRTGPVFASAFSPLMMIIVAVMGSFILSEQIYLGGVVGAALIVVGLYSVLWGKHKETQEKQADTKLSLPTSKGAAAAAEAEEITGAGEDDGDGDDDAERSKNHRSSGGVRSSSDSNGHGASAV
jgi:hypothetical protein